MNANWMSKAAAAVVAVALTAGLGVGVANASGSAKKDAPVTGGYAKTDLPPTDTQLLRPNSSNKVFAGSSLNGVKGARKQIFQGEWTGRFEIFVSEGDSHEFKVSWAGFKGRKVVVWVVARGALGLEDSRSSWQRFELRNKKGRNVARIDYTFDATNDYGYWSGLDVWVVDRTGQYAKTEGQTVSFYASPASMKDAHTTEAICVNCDD